MKEIKLSQQGKHKNRFVALVDDEDFEYLNQWRWCVAMDKNNCYAQRYDKGRTIRMHRQIMKTPNNMEVDHVDHNGLNCQKYNLKNCTHAQNQRNRKTSGRSKYKGVSVRRTGRIIAQIRINKESHWLGSFKTEKDAALAYDNAAKIYHKEFANLNFK